MISGRGYFAPSFPNSLLSSSAICRSNGIGSLFTPRFDGLLLNDGRCVPAHSLGSTSSGFLYNLPWTPTSTRPPPALADYIILVNHVSAQLSHTRLAHINDTAVLAALRGDDILDAHGSVIPRPFCHACALSKSHKCPVPTNANHAHSAKKFGDRVHVDIKGPFVPDLDNCTYSVGFVDEATGRADVFHVPSCEGPHVLRARLLWE